MFLRHIGASIRKPQGLSQTFLAKKHFAPTSSSSIRQSHYAPDIKPASASRYTLPPMDKPNTAPDATTSQPSTKQQQGEGGSQKKKGVKSEKRLAAIQKARQATQEPAKKRAYQVPSVSSGGVPQPSPKYLEHASLEPVVLPEPRRILLVIDLNGTLIYRPNKHRPSHFVERPHAKRFLQYCLDTFFVAIWSSAKPENVQRMINRLLTPEQIEQCLVVWGRDQFGLTPADYNARVQVYKRLSTIWNHPEVASAHPEAGSNGRWDQTNTVLIDDSLEKARSEPFNILAIPEFAGLATEIPHVLPQVHDYLNSLSYHADLSRYIRQQPFKLDPQYVLPSE